MYGISDDKKAAIYQINDVSQNTVTHVKLNNDGLYALAADKDGFSIKMLDLRMRKVLKTFKDNLYYNSHEYNKVSWGYNDQYIISGNNDGAVLVWDVQSTKIKHNLGNTGHQGVIISTDYHNITNLMYTGDSRGNLFIWN